MWILKNSKDLLDNLKSRSFSQVSSIKTFDFSTLYTTLPHDKLKTRLKETIHKAFSHRNYGSKCVALGNKWSVCWSFSSITYLSPLEGRCFSRSLAYQWVWNCAPLLADLFLYSYESEFHQKLVKDKKIHELEPLISHTGILMTFYLSIFLDLHNVFHWYILQRWKLKRPQIQLRLHHFWTYTSNLTTVVNSVLKFMINGTTSILKS